MSLRIRLFLLAFFPLLAFAQFNRGYIITLSGDTVDGVLRNQPGMSYNKTVAFKPERRGTDEVIFSPDEIKGFFIHPILTFHAHRVPNPAGELEMHFLRCHHEGPITIYEREDKRAPLFFARKGEGKLHLLGRKRDGHMLTFKQFTADCHDFRMPWVRYSVNGFVRIARLYENHCH